MTPGHRLSLAAARRIALAAQGFGRPHPASVTSRHVQGVIDRVAQFQIDSVNVVARAAYLPLFSRLGPYDTALLDAASGRPPRRLFEYWGHEASLIDVRLWQALQFRMTTPHWGGVERIRHERPELLAQVLAEVAGRRGGATARQLDDGRPRTKENWGWNWSDTKRACELLFRSGELTAARRNASFERVYHLPSRVLPASALDAPALSVEESHEALARRALRALGVADVASIADYFRTPRASAAAALARLVAGGEAERVTIAGLAGEWFLDPAVPRPRRLQGAALVSPFDSMVFHRPRLERLFGFNYRIEIYVPAHLRKHGYYVYPFLLGDQFVARVDLKADRAAGVLRVLAAWSEDGQQVEAVAPTLAGELRRLASWLGLDDMAITPLGDLGPALAALH